mmetsp:Transcript_20861/g.71925  ORF Transcript_20861/g.71925 Transcript_20861/m.71925 type:complete len:502 (+) Transcript_20861:79-1584(+)
MPQLLRLGLWFSATVTLSRVGATPSCGIKEGRCSAAAAAGEHLLLQLERGGHLSNGPAVTDDANSCNGMPDIKRKCSSNSCKVLAENMKHFSCSEFCHRSGRRCIRAWEEVSDDCEVRETLSCDQTYGDTSDLLCECSPEVVGVFESAAAGGAHSMSTSSGCKKSCTDMPDVEQKCSPSGCKVLVTNMKDSSCSSYCARTGRACVAAFEEVDETCGVKEVRICDQTYDDTSDLICECAPSEADPAQVGGSSTSASTPSWELVWSDEFDGHQVDRSKWHLEHAGGGFGNEERQFYRERNAHVGLGSLHITAKCEHYDNHGFTSAKLMTKDKSQWGPGHKIEVRAKLPKGKGTWPAIWMLPAQNAYGRWPASGEIDIMEAVGCSADQAHGTVHTGSYNHMTNTQVYSILATPVSQWHTYTLDWTKLGMQWYVDDQLYGAFAPSEHDSGKWPFDQEFYLILNLAVGGSWGGSCLKDGTPSCSSSNEFGNDQVMEVDYARVYRQA